MPGVGGMVSGLPYFYLRGAPPANTGYFIDGIPVPMLFHVGPGPSVVPNGLIGRVEFYPGTAPARYGRFAGGIIAGETRSPSRSARGEAGARVFDANALLETPVTVSTTGLVAGRYGYPNVLLSLFAPRLSLKYWDYTVRASKALSASGTLSLTVFGALDEIHDDMEQIAPLDTQFHRVDLRYQDYWDGGWLRVGTTFGIDTTGEKRQWSEIRATARNTSTRFRAEVHQRVLPWAELEFGGDIGVERATIRDSDEEPESWNNPTVEGVGGAYAEVVAKPTEGIELSPGIRFDVSRFGGERAVWADPRLRARVRVARGLHWLTGAGLAHQTPSYLLPVAGLKLGLWGEIQTTRQLSQGLETSLPWSLKTTLTGFYHSHANTTDYVAGCGTFQPDCSVIDSLDGRTFGLEVLLERTATSGLSGWLAYTLSRAERTLGSLALLSAFDRTHVFSGVLSYRWATGYSVGLRGTYYSGRPDVPSIAVGVNGARFAIQPGQAPQHRLPEFYRVDVRAEKRWPLTAQRWLAVVFDFFNVTLQKEAMEYWCNFDGLCTARRFGPVALPSIGMEAGF